MKIEKEIKLKITENIAKKIFNNPKFNIKKDVFQRTTRRDTFDEKYEKKGIFIRTRDDEKGSTITMKKKIEGDKKDVFKREEYETTIGDSQTINEILKTLGLEASWTMEKYRIEGEYDNVTLTIDELPFGLFMEIEADEDEDIPRICKELGLDMEKKIVVTYWDVWEEYKKENNIKEEKDIIFKNKKSFLKSLV